MNKRKELCPCGSGKRFKNCCLGKKPRQIVYEWGLGGMQRISQIRIEKNTGIIELLHDGKSIPFKEALTQVTYDRQKGKKVLVEAPADSQMDISGALYADRYEHLLAVDTNTKLIGPDSVSICCVMHGRAAKITGYLAVERHPVLCFEFRNAFGKPENIAWREVIRGLPITMRLQPLGFIVDSDLGLLRQYNAQAKPIWDDFLLPTNIRLIYASSDFPRQSAFNNLIAYADKESRIVLDHINKHPEDRRDLKEVTNRPFTHYRRWKLCTSQSDDPNHINITRR